VSLTLFTSGRPLYEIVSTEVGLRDTRIVSTQRKSRILCIRTEVTVTRRARLFCDFHHHVREVTDIVTVLQF
jgi:hypothetical protein